MNTTTARATIKAINRYVNKNQVFQGGRQWGIDFATWAVCYPQMAKVLNEAAEIVTGRKGRFLPRFK